MGERSENRAGFLVSSDVLFPSSLDPPVFSRVACHSQSPTSSSKDDDGRSPTAQGLDCREDEGREGSFLLCISNRQQKTQFMHLHKSICKLRRQGLHEL